MYKGIKEVKDADGKLITKSLISSKGAQRQCHLRKASSKIYMFLKYGACKPRELFLGWWLGSVLYSSGKFG